MTNSAWPSGVATLRLTAREWGQLLDYSASTPTGYQRGKRWRRLDGKHGSYGFGTRSRPRWVILEFGDRAVDGTTTLIAYRPVIVSPVQS